MILRSILNALFPKQCLACGAEGTYCCDRCRNVIEKRREPRIYPCAAPLDCLFAACTYNEQSLLARLIHRFKYKFSDDLAEFFIDYTGPVLANLFNPADCALVPVPLHRRRKAFRGFNQAELLCRGLSVQYGYQWIPALKRIRNTPPQARLPRTERLTNPCGAFSLDRRFAACINNTRIVLIDDVAATQTTLSECARVLKTSGAREVYGLIIASSAQCGGK